MLLFVVGLFLSPGLPFVKGTGECERRHVCELGARQPQRLQVA